MIFDVGGRAKGLLALSLPPNCDGRRTKGDCLSVAGESDAPFLVGDFIAGDAATTVAGDSGRLKGDWRDEADMLCTI